MHAACRKRGFCPGAGNRKGPFSKHRMRARTAKRKPCRILRLNSAHKAEFKTCARHGQVLTGESPECRSISAKHIAKGKGVHREVESEGSRRQTSGLTDRNHIRHDRMGKAASKAEARKLIRNPMVCMWQIDGRKEPVLTRGGLMDA